MQTIKIKCKKCGGLREITRIKQANNAYAYFDSHKKTCK
jgi:hypothetical protein